MGAIVDQFNSPSQEDGITTVEAHLPLDPTDKIQEAGQFQTCYAEDEQEIFKLDIRSLCFAMERGSVAVAARILRDDPDFMKKAVAFGAEMESVVLEALSWLRNSEAHEDANGHGSMLDVTHPFNIQMALSLKKILPRR